MLVAGGDPGLTAMPTLLKALRGISLLSLLAKGASPLRIPPVCAASLEADACLTLFGTA